MFDSLTLRVCAADQPRGTRAPLLLRAGPRQGGLRELPERQPGLLPAAGL